MRLLLTLLLAAAALAAPAEDFARRLPRILRELQLALEGNSAQGVLALLDRDKFPEYSSFQDTIVRLTREDNIRAHFEELESRSPAEGKATVTVDAEMEMTRRDASGQTRRRREKLVLEFENTRRGWRITNLAPRAFFEPL